MIGESTLGRTCLRTILGLPTPRARAASIKSSPFTESTEARAVRA
ncbi:MAG: hypothetical protein AVDCRST_MAG02-2710 [uncultured Rubrobacteraceae bacterium]|uniref:Uncharacterized protein n=1 Tax=uncultured Rubrobacteraceae bacterium TaxID=349277 RepID=A0A6J4R4H9_9ACTN|nr:MAG: hypothetical protein AVDCRST_MAG02-2710 [uncultured Rubrobacteraceae bacterium]